MRHTFRPSLSPCGDAIAYIVRDGGYPYAVQANLIRTPGDTPDTPHITLSAERPVTLPVDGPVTTVLHSPDSRWIACEASPKGSERLETFIVSTDPTDPGATPLRSYRDAKTTLVEWDHHHLAMDAVNADGITEARLVDPETSRYTVMDRRCDALLVAVEAGYCLMRVGPRGNRELLLTTPHGDWIPLLPPEPGASTEDGRILALQGNTLIALVATNHGADWRRILRIEVELPEDATSAPRTPPRRVSTEEIIASTDADIDEFVISEDLTTAAVLWNQSGVSQLEVLTLNDTQQVMVRRSVELPGMVAANLTITDDGTLIALTVEGPNLPPTVEILRVDAARIESILPEPAAIAGTVAAAGAAVGAVATMVVGRASAADVAAEVPAAASASTQNIPELVHYTARDGLELSGWLYIPDTPAPGRPAYIHIHGGPEGQSRPVNHDVLADLVAAGITVFTPNIRGSKGNGKAFSHADDRYGRFSAVDDVVDSAHFLHDAGLTDPARIYVGGRSYGGFLSLLTAARYPDTFAGVVDACGMTSFETYYEFTEPWLASAASPKYGYPMHDAELLLEISPLYKAEQITAPVLLIHGDNDTNVPIGESEQMYEALLAARGTAEDLHLLRLAGEGHKFVKRSSRNQISQAMREFMLEIEARGRHA